MSNDSDRIDSPTNQPIPEPELPIENPVLETIKSTSFSYVSFFSMGFVLGILAQKYIRFK